MKIEDRKSTSQADKSLWLSVFSFQNTKTKCCQNRVLHGYRSQVLHLPCYQIPNGNLTMLR